MIPITAGFSDKILEEYPGFTDEILEELRKRFREQEYIKKTTRAITAQVQNLESGRVLSAEELGPDADRIELEWRGVCIIPSFQLDDVGILRPKCREINRMLAAYLDPWEIYWWWHTERMCERGIWRIPVRLPTEGRLVAPATRWRRSAARATISVRKRMFFSGGEI